MIPPAKQCTKTEPSFLLLLMKEIFWELPISISWLTIVTMHVAQLKLKRNELVILQ